MLQVGDKAPDFKLPTTSGPDLTLDVVAANAVRRDHLAFEVADQVKRQSAQLGGECLVREHRVDADAVDADSGCDRVLVP